MKDTGERRRYVDFRMQPSRTELKQMIKFDPLTGLRSKSVLIEELGREIDLFNRGSSDFAVAYIDVDNFKKINDVVHHGPADRVLKLVAKTFGEVLRSTDTAYRKHGDEFQLILRSIDPDRTGEMEDHLKSRLRSVFRDKMGELGEEIYLEADLSVGFAYPQPGDNPDIILDRADRKMQEDKVERKMGR